MWTIVWPKQWGLCKSGANVESFCRSFEMPRLGLREKPKLQHFIKNCIVLFSPISDYLSIYIIDGLLPVHTNTATWQGAKWNLLKYSQSRFQRHSKKKQEHDLYLVQQKDMFCISYNVTNFSLKERWQESCKKTQIVHNK